MERYLNMECADPQIIEAINQLTNMIETWGFALFIGLLINGAIS